MLASLCAYSLNAAGIHDDLAGDGSITGSENDTSRCDVDRCIIGSSSNPLGRPGPQFLELHGRLDYRFLEFHGRLCHCFLETQTNRVQGVVKGLLRGGRRMTEFPLFEVV